MHCLIAAILASELGQYIFRIWLKTSIFPYLSPGGRGPLRFQNPKENTFDAAFQMASKLVSLLFLTVPYDSCYRMLHVILTYSSTEDIMAVMDTSFTVVFQTQLTGSLAITDIRSGFRSLFFEYRLLTKRLCSLGPVTDRVAHQIATRGLPVTARPHSPAAEKLAFSKIAVDVC